ncbi:MAG: 2TM domain-containing protein [Thermoplasmatota archaeon]
MRNDEMEKSIRKRVRNIRDFYTHAVVYLVVNILLVVIWYFTGSGFPWFIFPLCGWGIGLFFHWYSVFVEEGILGKKWEDRKVEELMKKEKTKRRK